MDTLDDAALATRLLGTESVDQDAEAELCRRFGTRIRLYGLRHLRDEDAAADLVQDVLALVLQRLRAGEVREPEKLASFVLGTCRLTVRNLQRTARRRGALLAQFAVEPQPQDGSPLATDAQLAGCLQRLEERARAVVVLTWYAQRSAAEIGEELGMTAGNVRVVRHRAIGNLRTCLKIGGVP